MRSHCKLWNFILIQIEIIYKFVSYLEKEKRYDIETLSTDSVLDMENFY